MATLSPVRSVWLNPATTVARIAHENPEYRLLVLPLLAGCAVLPSVWLFGYDKDFMEGLLLSTLISFGPLIELLQVFVGAWLIRVTGYWLGGRASSSSLQVAIVWGNLPIALLALLGFAAFGVSVTLSELTEAPVQWGATPAIFGFGFAVVLVEAILLAWSFWIVISGVASLQGFSRLRALANILLASAIPLVALVLIAVLSGTTHNLDWYLFAGLSDMAEIYSID